jgi:DNA-binding NarL/FixJ family response regulator
VQPDALSHALVAIAEGGAIFDPFLAVDLLHEFRRLSPSAADEVVGVERLTVREREVLTLTGQGATNPEIAQTLAITQDTVKVHLQHITEKLHLRSRHHAAAFAAQAGLVGMMRQLVEGADERSSTLVARASY